MVPSPVPFHDPSRRVLGTGRPCWQKALMALPTLDLTPCRDPEFPKFWEIRVIISGAWEVRLFPESMLAEVLDDWTAGPEACLKKHWGADEPTDDRPTPKFGRPGLTADLSAEDLGL